LKTSLLSDLLKTINTKVKVKNIADTGQKSFRQVIAELKLSLSEMRQTENLNAGRFSNAVQITSAKKDAPFMIDGPLKRGISQVVQKSSSTETELSLQSNSGEKTIITPASNEKNLSFQNIDPPNESANSQSQNASENAKQHQSISSKTPNSPQVSSNAKAINVNTIADSQNASENAKQQQSITTRPVQRVSDNKTYSASTTTARPQNVSSNSTRNTTHHNEKFTAIQADKSLSQRSADFIPSLQKDTLRTQNRSRRLHILGNSHERPSIEENHLSAIKSDSKRKSMNQKNPSTVYVKTLDQEKRPNHSQISRTHLAEVQHAMTQNRIARENQLQPHTKIKVDDNTEKPKGIQQTPSFTRQIRSQRSIHLKSAFNSNENNFISRNAMPEKDLQNISSANQQVILSEEKISTEVSAISQAEVSAQKLKAIHSSQPANIAEVVSQRNSLVSDINAPSSEQIRIIARKVFLKIENHDSRAEFLITKRQTPAKLKVSEPIKIETFKLEIAREIKKDSPALSSSKTLELDSKTTNNTARLINNENAKRAYSNLRSSTFTVNQTDPNVNLVTERVSQQEMSNNLDRIIDNIRPYLTRETVTERAVMDLSPPNLGRLEIQIEKQREILKISMRVSNEEAKEIVEKGSKNLIARLNSMGFKVEEFQVKVETEQNDHSEQNFQNEQHERRRQQREQQNHTDESEVDQDDQRN